MLYEVKCEFEDYIITENVEADSKEDAINKFKELSNDYIEVIEDGDFNPEDAYIIAYRTFILSEFKYLKVKSEDIQELFEILCNVPFEITMMSDEFPRTTRHPAVEFLIDQLAPYYDMGEFT